MSGEWGAPQTSDTRRPSDGLDRLLTRVQKGERQVRDLPHQILRAARLKVETGVLRVLGSLIVEGDAEVSGTLSVTGPMTVGGTLEVTGDAVFSGDLAVPNGSITNDALASPITVGVAPTTTTTAWSVTTSMVTKASTAITVPSGFSRAIVSAGASMHFQDSAPNGGWVRAVIDGSSGGELGGLANLNIGGTAFHTMSMTGLSGGTIALEAQVRATASSSVTTGRIAQITGYAIFLR